MLSFFQHAYNKMKLTTSLSCLVLLIGFTTASVAGTHYVYTFKDQKTLTSAMAAIATQTTRGVKIPDPCRLHIISIDGASILFQKSTFDLMNKALAEGIVGSDRLDTCSVKTHELTHESAKVLIAREQARGDNAHIFQIIYIPISEKILAYASFHDGKGQLVGTVKRFELPVQKASDVLTTAAIISKPKVVTRKLAEVHFDPASSKISYVGQQKIKRAIEAIKEQKPVEIRVFGFTDTVGDPVSNMAISQARANSVASAIKKAGLDIQLVVKGRGEGAGPYQTPDGLSEPMNRCVGIIAVFEKDGQ